VTRAGLGRALLASTLIAVSVPACRRFAAEHKETDREKEPDNRAEVVTVPPEAMRSAGIVISAVSARAESDRLRIPGTVQADPRKFRQVTALTAGRVERVNVAPGDRIRAGAPLARIVSAEVADVRGKVVQAQARRDVARSSLERVQRLVTIGAAPGKDLTTAEAELRSAEADLEHVRAQLRVVGAEASGGSMASFVVAAPLDGRVLESMATPGAGVQQGQALFTIADLSTVWIVGEVPEAKLSAVRPAATVRVTAPALGDRALDGRVDTVDARINPDTRSAAVRIVLPNPNEVLKVGMYVDVWLELASGESRPTLYLPESAVERFGDRAVVFLPVPGKPSSFEVRDVEAGKTIGGVRRIVKGLSPGDRVVTGGTFTLKSLALKGQFGEEGD
jgi:membrane fusion protein, heavy metal efflux system